MNREPSFENIIKILNREKPSKPVLFEFFMNNKLYEKLADECTNVKDFSGNYKFIIKAFYNAGYDYATLKGSDFKFHESEENSKKTISINDGSLITNREDFEKYRWLEPEAFDYSRLEKCKKYLPEGMKIIVWGPGGVFENVVDLVGYDNLCYMLSEDIKLIADIFQEVGERLIKYYEICAKYESVGALISNDDWGFQSQTLISPDDLRKYVFPYHKRIVETIHRAGKPAILHSCGNLSMVMNDIIDDLKYDGKHSFEDKIMPVEEAYKKYHDRIAILGGIDMDFLCRRTTDEITKRCQNILKITNGCTGYALGSGNSIPEYVPHENYFAMINSIEI